MICLSLERIIHIINSCDFVISMIWKGLIPPIEGAEDVCESTFNNLLIKLLYLKLQDAYVCQNLLQDFLWSL